VQRQAAQVGSAKWVNYSKNPKTFDDWDKKQAKPKPSSHLRLDIKDKFKEVALVNGQRTIGVRKVDTVLVAGIDDGDAGRGPHANGAVPSKGGKGAGVNNSGGNRKAESNNVAPGSNGISTRPGFLVSGGVLPVARKSVGRMAPGRDAEAKKQDEGDLISLI
jgi:hypothetical protein